MAINLNSLSPAELQALVKDAEAQMESARKNQIQEVRTKMDALLKAAGLTIDESPRVLRRLPLLREWSHEQVHEVFL